MESFRLPQTHDLQIPHVAMQLEWPFVVPVLWSNHCWRERQYLLLKNFLLVQQFFTDIDTTIIRLMIILVFIPTFKLFA